MRREQKKRRTVKDPPSKSRSKNSGAPRNLCAARRTFLFVRSSPVRMEVRNESLKQFADLIFLAAALGCPHERVDSLDRPLCKEPVAGPQNFRVISRKNVLGS